MLLMLDVASAYPKAWVAGAAKSWVAGVAKSAANVALGVVLDVLVSFLEVIWMVAMLTTLLSAFVGASNAALGVVLYTLVVSVILIWMVALLIALELMVVLFALLVSGVVVMTGAIVVPVVVRLVLDVAAASPNAIVVALFKNFSAKTDLAARLDVLVVFPVNVWTMAMVVAAELVAVVFAVVVPSCALVAAATVVAGMVVRLLLLDAATASPRASVAATVANIAAKVALRVVLEVLVLFVSMVWMVAMLTALELVVVVFVVAVPCWMGMRGALFVPIVVVRLLLVLDIAAARPNACAVLVDVAPNVALAVCLDVLVLCVVFV